MIKRTVEENLMIKECYMQFNQDKVAQGIGNVGTLCYYGEIKHFLEEIQLTEDDYISVITTNDFNNYVISLRKRNLALATINHNIRCVRVFLYWCMNNNYLKRFQIKLVKGQEEKIKFYSDEEIELLLKKPSKEANFIEWRNYVLTCFVMSTGARASTLLNIKYSDIDFRGHEITFTHLKNKQVTSVPLGASLEKVLIEYLRMWKRSSDDFFLFPEVNEGKLTINALGHSYAKYCEKRCVQRRGIHALRHTFARCWIKNGGNAFTLQHMLTHSDLTMTKKYVRLFSEDLKEGFEQYSPLDRLTGSNRVRRAA